MEKPDRQTPPQPDNQGQYQHSLIICREYVPAWCDENDNLLPPPTHNPSLIMNKI